MRLPCPRVEAARDQRGTAAWLMPFLGVLVVAALVLALQGGVLVAQRRVQAAADLAALAGASALQRGEDGCAAAAATARRNGARLTRCLLAGTTGRELIVTLARDGPEVLRRAVEVQASARAGPAMPP